MKQVRIADLKARLSEHLRRVRRGHPLLILDRDTPIARILPIANASDKLAIRRAPQGRTELGKVPIPPAVDVDVDIVSLLIEERRGER